MFAGRVRSRRGARRTRGQGGTRPTDEAALADAGPLAVFRWAALRIYGPGSAGGRWRRLKFIVRAGLAPGLASRWILSLIDGPMRPAALRTPRLFEKPQRLYLNRHWRAAHRHAVLCDHYDWLCRAFGAAQLEQLYREDGLRLATLDCALPQPVTLVLRYDAAFEREGELALSLRLDGRTVVSLAFTIGRDALGRRQLLIGCVQSRDGADALAVARELTHALHGLRPKALLTAAAQALAAEAGMARVLAVADEAHVFRSARYLLKRRLIGRHRVLACYDTLWAECGGEPVRQGFYELPVQSARRDPAAIKPNKRAMYRRRYGLLDSISEQLRRFPAVWAGGAAVAPPLSDAPLPAATRAAQGVGTLAG